MKLPESEHTYDQVRKIGPRIYTEGGMTYRISLDIRHDDRCKSGHNTFSMTCVEHKKAAGSNRWRESGGGHGEEAIARHFPEFAPYLKWHLCSTNGPWDYLAKAIYFAGERDCWGKLKGEPAQWDTFVQFGSNPIKHKPGNGFVQWLAARDNFALEVVSISRPPEPSGYTYKPKYTYGGFAAKWAECPFYTEGEARDFLAALQTCSPQFVKMPTVWGEGKARELDLARRAAIWPDATDAELMLPEDELRAKLEARLPGLMAEFKSTVEYLGFIY